MFTPVRVYIAFVTYLVQFRGRNSGVICCLDHSLLIPKSRRLCMQKLKEKPCVCFVTGIKQSIKENMLSWENLLSVGTEWLVALIFVA